MINFLNQPGSLPEGHEVRPENVQRQVLGDAGSKFIDAGFGSFDPDADPVESPVSLSSIIEQAQESITGEEIKVSDEPDDDFMPNRMDTSPSGLTVATPSKRFDPIRFLTGGAISGKPAFIPSETPLVTGDTIATGPMQPSVSEQLAARGEMPKGGRAYTLKELDDLQKAKEAVADALYRGDPDVSSLMNEYTINAEMLGLKDEKISLDDSPLKRQADQKKADEAAVAAAQEPAAPAVAAAPKAAPKAAPIPPTAPKAAPKAAPAKQSYRGLIDLTPSEMDLWKRTTGALKDYAVSTNLRGQNMSKVILQTRELASKLNLNPKTGDKAFEDIYYSTDLGKSDPEYASYLEETGVETEEPKTKVAGGLVVPEEGGNPAAPALEMISDEQDRRSRAILAEPMAEKAPEKLYAVQPTDPDSEGRLVITSLYGTRGDGEHEGIDLRARKIDGNTNVYSVMDGTISAVQSEPVGGAGRYVYVSHEDGTQTRYFHGENIPENIKVGNRVLAGDLIMIAGESGNSKGPHLHFEIGRVVDGKFESADPMVELPEVFNQYELDEDLILKSTC